MQFEPQIAPNRATSRLGGDVKTQALPEGSGAPSRTPADRASRVFAIVDPRRLERECFIHSVEAIHGEVVFLGYSSAEAYLRAAGSTARVDAVIFNIGSHSPSEPATAAEIKKLVERANFTPIAILGESEGIADITAAIEAGASGYIPASVGVDAIVEAARLAASGGVVITVKALAAIRSHLTAQAEAQPTLTGQLTSRQAAVANSLRLGKPNKIIAYELSMCESTVKVHIRTILKKLKAANRTEAAYKLNAIHAAKDGSLDCLDEMDE